MNRYNNQLGLRDLFMNPVLGKVFPQFDRNQPLFEEYSVSEIQERVQKYLAGALNGIIRGKDEIIVRGKPAMVLYRVQQLQPLIEGLFENLPKITQALKTNTRLYLPYANIKQIQDIRARAEKQKALKLVLDNFQYNSDLGALNSIKKEPPAQFKRNRKAWETRVGKKVKRI